MSPEVGVTNDQLFRAVMELKDEMRDMNVVVATTQSAVKGLRNETQNRHQENKREIGKIHAGISQSNAEVKKVAAKVDSQGRDIAIMKPVVRRLRMRELWRRALVQCFGRWRTLFVAVGVSVGGAVTWLNDGWPKLLALLRKIGGGG